MAKHTDVLIIGAGIIGCGTAYYLAKHGVSVTVLEREMSGHGGSCRNAGGVRQSARDIRELPLAMYSVSHIWPSLTEELGVDVEYHQAGNLRPGLTEKHMEILHRLADNCRKDGLAVEVVDGKEARELCPYMSEEVIGASWCPSDGNANALMSTLGYYRRARELGARFITGEEVERLELHRGAVRRVITRRGNVYEAEKVLVAAGYESRMITAGVGIDLPLIRKYDECLVTEPQPEYFRMTLGTADADFYGHQTDHGSFVFGGDCGFEYFHRRDEEGTEATSYSAACMTRNILRYFPVLSDVRVVRQWGGWLDKCMDGVPIISPVEEVPGLFLAAGFSGHGFGIAPAVALCLSQMILGEKTAVDLSSLAYNRFKTTN